MTDGSPHPLILIRIKGSAAMEKKRTFLLLQINDALFPIGGYSHSYGLETYIQKELVTNAVQAEEYIRKKITHNFVYNDLFYCRLAWEAADSGSLEKLEELEEIVEAGKVPAELRDASRKMGSRFVKTLKACDIPYETDIFKRYTEQREGRTYSHTVAYGVFCRSTGFSLDDCLEHFLYSQVSAMVTNCVKTIPLSQTTGQKILVSCYEAMDKVLEQVKELPLFLLGAGAPGFDIRCMQHEALYSRIYMS